MNIKEQFGLAKLARENAHEPYCNYNVGAALKTKNGKIYTGCNVSNYGIQSICAERVAFVKAISEGEREFESIVVVGGHKNGNLEECLPCGYCRQFMNEFVQDNFKVYTENGDKVNEYTLDDLLPNRFKL